MLIEKLPEEVIRKTQEVEERSRKIINRDCNPLTRDARYRAAFETKTWLAGDLYYMGTDLTMQEFVLSSYPIKEPRDGRDLIGQFYKGLWPHIANLIEGYEISQMNLQLNMVEQDKLLRKIADIMTSSKLQLEFLKQKGLSDEFTEWEKSFKEKIT